MIHATSLVLAEYRGKWPDPLTRFFPVRTNPLGPSRWVLLVGQSEKPVFLTKKASPQSSRKGLTYPGRSTRLEQIHLDRVLTRRQAPVNQNISANTEAINKALFGKADATSHQGNPINDQSADERTCFHMKGDSSSSASFRGLIAAISSQVTDRRSLRENRAVNGIWPRRRLRSWLSWCFGGLALGTGGLGLSRGGLTIESFLEPDRLAGPLPEIIQRGEFIIGSWNWLNDGIQMWFGC